MEGKSALRAAIIVSCLAITVLGYENANADNSEVVALASKTACPTDACNAVLSQTSRSSFGHEYSFQIRSKQHPTESGPTLIVECKRAYVLLGDWACKPK
jgi:hypothetical protein